MIYHFIILLLLSIIVDDINGDGRAYWDRINPHSWPPGKKYTHLCQRIANGEFSSIDIESATWLVKETGEPEPERELILFESDRKYYINHYSISKQYISLPDQYYYWTANELQSSLHFLTPLERATLRSVHYFYKQGLTEHIGEHFPHLKFPTLIRNIHSQSITALVVTDRAEYYIDISEREAERMMNQTQTKFFPTFAVLGSFLPNKSHGFIINPDVVDRTQDFVIYDLNVDDQLEITTYGRYPTIERVFRLHAHMMSGNSTNRQADAFYYLERTENSKQIKLVHRANRRRKIGDTRRQLFRVQPYGFIAKDQTLIMFDLFLGCVYIVDYMIENLTKHFHTSTNDIVLDRINVPFEYYFECDRSKYPLISWLPSWNDRCETTVNSFEWPESLSRRRSPPNIDRVSEIVYNFLLIIAILLVVIGLLWCAIVCLWYLSMKQNEQMNKSFSLPLLLSRR